MMITRCPACQTVFRLRPEQLHARGGEVRCGHCFHPFNALENTVEVRDEGGAAAPPPPEPEPIALTAGTANFINAGRATIEQTMNTNPTIGPAMVPDWSPNAPPLVIQKQVA